MCRRCGEPDRRGSSTSRRIRKGKLAAGQGVESQGGNGVITVCMWCYELVGLASGFISFTDPRDGTTVTIEIHRLEEDRLDGNGSPYRMDNLVPSCHACNIGRVYDTLEIPEGCLYGPERIEAVRAARKARMDAWNAALDAADAAEAVS